MSESEVMGMVKSAARTEQTQMRSEMYNPGSVFDDGRCYHSEMARERNDGRIVRRHPSPPSWEVTR